MTVEELKNKILLCRGKFGLSIEQLAKASGVTAQTIANIEKLCTNPSRLTVAKIENGIRSFENED